MSRKAVDETLEALFKLTDLRWLWRETAPSHKLSPEQKKKAKEIIAGVRASLDSIEKEVGE